MCLLLNGHLLAVEMKYRCIGQKQHKRQCVQNYTAWALEAHMTPTNNRPFDIIWNTDSMDTSGFSMC